MLQEAVAVRFYFMKNIVSQPLTFINFGTHP